jgi:hypothetical protein
MEEKEGKPHTEASEKPVVSITLDVYKKNIDEKTISVAINASLTGDKETINTLSYFVSDTIASIASAFKTPGSPFN